MGVALLVPELPLEQPESVPMAAAATKAKAISKGLCSKLLRRRLRPNSASIEPGSSNARLVGRSVERCPGSLGIERAASEPVPIVTVLLTTVPASVTDAGLNEHVVFDGSVPQPSVSVPVKPPTGVKVSVLVPVEPRAMVRVEGFTVTV